MASLKNGFQLRFLETRGDELEREYGVEIECCPKKVDGVILKRVVVRKR